MTSIWDFPRLASTTLSKVSSLLDSNPTVQPQPLPPNQHPFPLPAKIAHKISKQNWNHKVSALQNITKHLVLD